MIRAATLADVEAIERVRSRAWVRAYSDFIAPDRMLQTPEEERVALWRERIGGPVETWVFDSGGRVVALASAGPADEPDLDAASWGCLWALYVDPAAQGAGVGTRLLGHCEQALRGRGYGQAVLWVFSASDQARRFYERHGWRPEEGSEVHPPEWEAPGLRYRKDL